MTTLLQCPRPVSPCRNQTPGTTMRTVKGAASERGTNSAVPPRAANDSSNRVRIRLTVSLLPVYYGRRLGKKQGKLKNVPPRLLYTLSLIHISEPTRPY